MKVNPPKEGKNDSNQNKGHAWLHFPPLAIQGFSGLLQLARGAQRDLKLHETTGAGEIFRVRCEVLLISPTPVVELPDAPLIHSFNAFSCNFYGYIRPRVLDSSCPLRVFLERLPACHTHLKFSPKRSLQQKTARSCSTQRPSTASTPRVLRTQRISAFAHRFQRCIC